MFKKAFLLRNIKLRPMGVSGALCMLDGVLTSSGFALLLMLTCVPLCTGLALGDRMPYDGKEYTSDADVNYQLPVPSMSLSRDAEDRAPYPSMSQLPAYYRYPGDADADDTDALPEQLIEDLYNSNADDIGNKVVGARAKRVGFLFPFGYHQLYFNKLASRRLHPGIPRKRYRPAFTALRG